MYSVGNDLWQYFPSSIIRLFRRFKNKEKKEKKEKRIYDPRAL